MYAFLACLLRIQTFNYLQQPNQMRKKRLLIEGNNIFHNIEKVLSRMNVRLTPIYTTRLQTTYRVPIPGNDIVRDATLYLSFVFH